MSEHVYRQLSLGEPAPWFRQRSTVNPDFVFDTVGGRYIVLCFFGSAGDAAAQDALAFCRSPRSLSDDDRMTFFGVSTDPEDESSGRLQSSSPDIRHFWDSDGLVSRLYGALPTTGTGPLSPKWVVLNPGLQVIAVLPFKADGSDRRVLARFLSRLRPVSHYGGIEMHAPIIIVPEVFQRELCQRLIREYETSGGTPSGFMRDLGGRSVALHDGNHKKRSDHQIQDQELIKAVQQRVARTVAPVIRKVHCFEPTRMERYIVGCYDAESGGHFSRHRDNTTKATAHRRFALSVNLNDDFEGGELCFPEYGPRRYKATAGGAIVFAGALLHMVTPVRRGRRYAFLPFLYDDAAAALREKNTEFVTGELASYKA